MQNHYFNGSKEDETVHVWEVRVISTSDSDVSVGFARCETSSEAKRLVLNEIRDRTGVVGWQVESCIRCV